jgi:hypothetical protein
MINFTLETFTMPDQDPQSQYHDYAAKLDAAKQSVKVDESLRFAASEIDEVVQELRQMEDGKLYKTLANIYMLSAFLIFIVHIIFFGLWVGLIGLILLVVFYLGSKVVINMEIKLASNKSANIDHKELLTPAEIARKKMATKSIIELKTKRYQILLLMTSIFTPLVFMSLHELIFASLSMLNIGVAIALGSFFWMIYFKRDIDLLAQMKERIATV